ncbi:MAG: presqualene diphosphate synthase HpnD [Thermoleophilaceae bacterium]
MVDVRAAQRFCEQETRREAGNFYYGIRLLPEDKRRAMCAVYAFARRVDDIGDGNLPEHTKLSLLDDEDRALERIEAGGEDPVMVAVADARERFALPLDALADLIAGVRMDVRPERLERAEDLVAYCRLVAGSIGRACVAIFGATDPARAALLADDLGVAMQLTNILRDVREDAGRGRVYLPTEDLARFECAGFPAADPAAAAALVAFEAARAHDWFERGLELIPMLDRRSAACVLTMAGIYRRLLARIDSDPSSVLETRVSLPAWEKAWVAARSLAGASA